MAEDRHFKKNDWKIREEKNLATKFQVIPLEQAFIIINSAGVGRGDPGQTTQQSRFASAVCAQNRDGLARADFQRGAVQCANSAVRFADCPEFNFHHEPANLAAGEGFVKLK